MTNMFNQADVPFCESVEFQPREGEQIIVEDGRKYVMWHDLIDVKVPLFTDASILLGKRVPLPLHGRNPRSILTQIDEHWWDRTRRRVYEVNNKHCACCGVHQSQQKGWVKNQLDAHEVYDVDYKTGEARLKCIVPLCKYCHQGVHFGRLTAQRDSGKIQDQTFYSIISHCNSVLDDANLPEKNWDVSVNDNIYNVPWEKYHLTLIIEGKQQDFYSLYKDEEELNRAYS